MTVLDPAGAHWYRWGEVYVGANNQRIAAKKIIKRLRPPFPFRLEWLGPQGDWDPEGTERALDYWDFGEGGEVIV